MVLLHSLPSVEQSSEVFILIGDIGLSANLVKKLTNRGPDATGEVILPLGVGHELCLLGTVLQMRGELTPQPLRDGTAPISDSDKARHNYLLWNGNIFGGVKVDDGQNDTYKVLEEFNLNEDGGELVLVTLSKIHGPWAFIYWQEATSSLWFGRDIFGRRSLVWHLPVTDDDVFCLCSIGSYNQDDIPMDYWSEVPASCVYQFKCPKGTSDQFYQSELAIRQEIGSLKSCLKTTLLKDDLLQAPFPILNKSIPLDDAQSVSATESTMSKEREVINAASCSVGTVSEDPCPEKKSIIEKFHRLLEEAVSVRVCNAPNIPSHCDVDTRSEKLHCDRTKLKSSAECCFEVQSTTTRDQVVVNGQAKVAILFSGGVDSAVLAALVDRCLPLSEEVDLINVAFENGSTKTSEPSFEVPDRISAIQCLKELNSKRKWNLVKVDVVQDEVAMMRTMWVSQLIYPLCTVLDDSIGCALWFGARGRGLLYGDVHQACYVSQAKTLLIGIGADEQLGGYSRHRTKFKSDGWSGLLAELDKDTKRLAQRNLGRDDRCVADHHREGEYPFLDENVVMFLQQLPIWDKVDLKLPRGIGEKFLLREVAMLLNCPSAAKLPKRAIQFGSRIAKLSGSSGGRESASDKCSRLFLSTS